MVATSHLRALQALEIVVRRGSLKAAAEELAITPAAVGQRIRTIEDYLGLDLLVRGRSGIGVTRELDAAMGHLSAAFRELEAAAETLDFQRVHEIHVVADPALAKLWLEPRLAQFRDKHPNAKLCVNGVGDVPARVGQPDCEIWFGQPGDSAAEDRLFHDYLVPVSSPENMQRILEVPELERLEGFPLLHVDYYEADPDSIGWPEWVSRFGYHRTGAGRGIRYRQVTDAVEGVRSNAGMAICGLALILEEIGDRTLSLPFPVTQGAWTGRAYRVRFREGALRRSQTTPFRDWLLAQAKDTEARLGRLTTRSP